MSVFRIEKTRDFTPKINNITIGLSSGTSGNRGIFLVSEQEKTLWALYTLNKILQQYILNYIDLRYSVVESDTERLFVNDKGKPLSASTVGAIVKKYMSKVSNAERISPHVLRHSFATHLLNNGADINAIKELLGHSSLAATQVYTHNTVEKLKKIYKSAHPRA